MDNPNCGRCGHLNMRGDCNLTACPFPTTKTEVLNIKKPTTNADRVRSMTDEELAEFFVKISDYICKKPNRYCDGLHCQSCAIDWLKQENE